MSTDILFATVDLPLLEKQQARDDIMALDEKLWFWDNYRSTSMLPLMTKGGVMGAKGSSNARSGSFEWTPYAPQSVKTWFDSVVFPWMGMRTRISALLTKPFYSNSEHIDCDPIKMGTQQHKFRVVLQGQTDTLYFITANGNVAAPNTESCFIMDGSWPHGMTNNTDQYKLTLAVGAPWNGNHSYTNITVLQKRSEHLMPSNYSEYFNTK
jgi:hypothetical protein